MLGARWGHSPRRCPLLPSGRPALHCCGCEARPLAGAQRLSGFFCWPSWRRRAVRPVASAPERGRRGPDLPASRRPMELAALPTRTPDPGFPISAARRGGSRHVSAATPSQARLLPQPAWPRSPPASEPAPAPEHGPRDGRQRPRRSGLGTPCLHPARERGRGSRETSPGRLELPPRPLPA